MKRAVRDSQQLIQLLGLDALAGEPVTAEQSFPTFVPWEYLRRIKHGDPHDPLLRQVLAAPEEDDPRAGFVSDPVGDLNAVVAGGLIQKYARRALVITTGACGVHCRYCFRRQFPYSEEGSRAQRWQPAIDYLRQHAEIDEVLLSGGDPLTLADGPLFALLDELQSVPQLRRLRIHSRMPVVIPQRLTEELIGRLATSPLAVWLVIHANHPQELDAAVLDRLQRVISVGIPVLNQAVLLRGVNDSVETLDELCRKLVDHRIHPYYLHQLDRVQGAAHFEVPVQRGRELIQQLRERLPGYAVPTYVVEEAGERSKTVIEA